MEEKDYKKLYEDVLERAKNGLKDKNYYLSQSAKEVTEFLFPQLKETKFKVGDWVTDGNNVLKIKCLGNEFYCFESTNGYIDDILISELDSKYHIWTIKDANDGDVLYHKSPLSGIEYIVMSMGVNGYGAIDSYFRYNSVDGFDTNIPSVLSAKSNDITPATKEQRDFLFQKMHEAGYEWDAEKKKLNKIVQNPTEKPDVLMSLDEAIEHCKEKSCSNNACALEHKQLEKWLTELKELKEHKPVSWSEEDDYVYNEILKRLADKKLYEHDLEYIYVWLKALKPQQNQYDKGYEDGYSAAKYNQWKPTYKQMEDFKMLLDYNIGVFDYAKFMSVDSLYEDLKKNLIDE